LTTSHSGVIAIEGRAMQYEAKKSNKYKEGHHSWNMYINCVRERRRGREKLVFQTVITMQIINSTSK
jgi:hypothetical protein